MKTKKHVSQRPTPATSDEPMMLAGAIKDFEEGVLCYVVARRYRGHGPVKLILHVAVADGRDRFGYGIFGHYVVDPATLMGMSTSERKSAAAILNGRKGGRPKTELQISP